METSCNKTECHAIASADKHISTIGLLVHL